MANTYTQINIHAIFAVYGRENLLLKSFRDRLFGYISQTLSNINQFPLSVGGYSDHVHIFFEYDPEMKLSDILRIVKANSSRWINEQGFLPHRFRWQKGYSAFSYQRSKRSTIINYIMNQEIHHAYKNFREEYYRIMKKFEINFDSKYIFEFYE